MADIIIRNATKRLKTKTKRTIMQYEVIYKATRTLED